MLPERIRENRHAYVAALKAADVAWAAGEFDLGELEDFLFDLTIAQVRNENGR